MFQFSRSKQEWIPAVHLSGMHHLRIKSQHCPHRRPSKLMVLFKTSLSISNSWPLLPLAYKDEEVVTKDEMYQLLLLLWDPHHLSPSKQSIELKPWQRNLEYLSSASLLSFPCGLSTLALAPLTDHAISDERISITDMECVPPTFKTCSRCRDWSGCGAALVQLIAEISV